MNRQSNTYTIIYASALVLIVGIILAIVYQSLRPQQIENINNDKRRQILAAALISVDKNQSIADVYNAHIKNSFIVDNKGNIVDTDVNPFDVEIKTEVTLPDNQRKLPVFECTTDKGLKYIVPVHGAGLWGPIWGYIAFDDNGDTIYGSYFAHEGETPGLGAEIEKPAFQKQFEGKNIFNNAGNFQSVMVVKQGQEPADGRSFVHAVSGGTITSQGVQKMLQNSLQPYQAFFKSLKQKNTSLK